MGVITNCCSRQTIIQSSSISVYSLSEEDSSKNNELYQNEILVISDIDQALKFITSKDYYILLLKKRPKHKISKIICSKLGNNDIITLINNLFQWIKNEEFEDCDENSKRDINSIKGNIKISLNFILKELKTIKYKEKIEIYILQALTSISLIIQCLLYLSNNKKEINEFKISIWGKKNIIDEAKKYGFQASYFLYLLKKKYQNNLDDDNKITNEKKEEYNSFFKTTIDFVNDLINS